MKLSQICITFAKRQISIMNDVFYSLVDSNLTQKAERGIVAAINEFHNKTCLRFVRKTANDNYT